MLVSKKPLQTQHPTPN